MKPVKKPIDDATRKLMFNIDIFFELQMTLKMYHWMTTSYARHKASDDGLATLLSTIDRFVEVYIGQNGRGEILSTIARSPRIPPYQHAIKYHILDDTQIIQYLGDAKKRLNTIDTYGCRDLTSIVDEMIEAVNQTIYLFTLV